MKTKDISNEEFVEKLREYGLSKHEAALYLATLASGSVGMSELARRAGIKRPTAYLAFRSLVTKGLMSTFKSTSGFKFTASRPETFLAKNKKDMESLTMLVPRLNAIAEKERGEPKIFYYEGKDGYFIASEDSLRARDKTIRHIGSLSELHSVISADYDYNSYIPRRTKAGIFFQALYFENEVSPEMTSRNSAELREIRYLPKEYFYKTSMLIYGNKVAIFSAEKELITVIIESEAMAESERKKFDLIWDIVGKN
jgi:sugar-specific transcriptional regulator TrmB